MRIIIGLINGMLASATPILLAALGGSLTFYAGIFNIASGRYDARRCLLRRSGHIISLLAIGIRFAILAPSDGVDIHPSQSSGRWMNSSQGSD